MLAEDANRLLQTFRRAVADTCAAKGVFSANLTGSKEDYERTRAVLYAALEAEQLAYVACQDAMIDCNCREREFGRAEYICTAKLESDADTEER
jgi:hypothetical protein